MGNVIALLTDFGLKDPYVGVMKGVILSVNPDARIIDLSHDLPSQGVLEAYFLLANTYRYFPKGTIFLSVVDPGVGTDRAILAVETDKYVFLAPDNGLLGFLEKDGAVRRIFRVTNRKYFLEPVSNTFHGRDIFAPAAAYLSQDVDLEELGEETKTMQRIEAPAPRTTREGVIVGEVATIDRFGNLVTNIPGSRLGPQDDVQVRVGKHLIRQFVRAYAEGKKGKAFAIVGSTGNLEIAVNQGNAQKLTGAKVGDAVRVNHLNP
jgi:S-adenosylmethionine hydrolase